MKRIFTLFVVSLMTLLSSTVIGQVVVVNPASPWIVPAGVTSITVTCWGGGGGGGGVYGDPLGGGGGGGGGGSTASSTFSVNPGDSYTITIGAGGGGGSNSGGNGAAGGNSALSGPGGSVIAYGGPGGDGDNGVAGGTTAGAVAGIGGYAGGSGIGQHFATTSETGGGGGGGAGNAGPGSDGIRGTGSSPSPGGAGGIGSPNAAPWVGGIGGNGPIKTSGATAGLPGSAPGGGGGGGSNYDSGTGVKGGNGGAGQVIITYLACTPPADPSIPTSNSPQCAPAGVTLIQPAGCSNCYWQGTNANGTSTAQPASIPYFTSTPGTYYVRSYDGSCWSSNSSSAVATINSGPCPQWLNQNCTVCPKGCYIDGGTVTPTRAIQTTSTTTDTSHYGYVYWTFTGVKDSTYFFSLCASTGTTKSRLRLHDGRTAGNNYCMDINNAPTLIHENIDNGCLGTGLGLSKLIWTCRTSGTYYLESAGENLTYWGAQSSQTATLTYKTLPSFSFVTSDALYDKGIDGTDGSSSSYNNNEDWIYTYYCTDTITSAISAQFLSFSTAPGDVLCVYDGNSVNAPMIGCYSGPSITGTFSSTATNGALTFQFSSDDSGVSGGWQANVSCIANVGVRNYASTSKISLFPNPVNNVLIIDHQSFTIRKIEITDILGQNVYGIRPEAQNPKLRANIDVSSLSPGIYFIRVESGSESWNGKFVKQ